MKEIRLNAFDMNCVGHIQQGLWTHPRDQSTRYMQLDYWTDYARRLEAGLFDGIFLADVLGVYDVLGGSPDPAVRHAVQVPVNDPALLIPAMAAVTKHLGFGVTANLTYEQPFAFARRIADAVFPLAHVRPISVELFPGRLDVVFGDTTVAKTEDAAWALRTKIAHTSRDVLGQAAFPETVTVSYRMGRDNWTTLVYYKSYPK